MLYGKRLAVPLKAVWNTELAKAYAETVHGTTRGYTKHRLHATVKSNIAAFYGQVPCVRIEWDTLPSRLALAYQYGGSTGGRTASLRCPLAVVRELLVDPLHLQIGLGRRQRPPE